MSIITTALIALATIVADNSKAMFRHWLVNQPDSPGNQMMRYILSRSKDKRTMMGALKSLSKPLVKASLQLVKQFLLSRTR